MEYLFCLGAGLAAALLVGLWLTCSGRRLLRLRCQAERADKELVMHRALSSQAQDGPNREAAAQMLETSRMLYAAAAQAYNWTVRHLPDRLPALLLGYRPIPEEAR